MEPGKNEKNRFGDSMGRQQRERFPGKIPEYGKSDDHGGDNIKYDRTGHPARLHERTDQKYADGNQQEVFAQTPGKISVEKQMERPGAPAAETVESGQFMKQARRKPRQGFRIPEKKEAEHPGHDQQHPAGSQITTGRLFFQKRKDIHLKHSRLAAIPRENISRRPEIANFSRNQPGRGIEILPVPRKIWKKIRLS